MKVSSVELKTRLGFYLRKLERGGEPVEVSIRNRAVAMLVPIGDGESVSFHRLGEGRKILQLLAARGLKVSSAANRGALPELADPVVAGDGREDVVTVAELRGAHDW